MSTLPGLYAHRVLRSCERVESHALIADELSDYLLRWAGTAAVDTDVFKLATPQLALYSMRYGDEVEILPQAYDDFLLVHYARKGAIEVVSDGQRQALGPGEVLISNPRRSVSLRWSAGCEQVILRVPHALLAQALTGAGSGGATAPPTGSGIGGQLANSGPLGPEHAFLRVPAHKMGAAESQMWQVQLDAFCAYAHGVADVPALAPWLGQVESSMAQFLGLQLLAQARIDPMSARPDAMPLSGDVEEAAAGHGLAAGSSVGAASTVRSRRPDPSGAVMGSTSGRDRQRRDRLLSYVDAHLSRPLSLEELAAVVALSPRQFTDRMHQWFGLSPMAWLRRRRLESARRSLIHRSEHDVTEVALAHGFAHLGRFSQYYKAAFDELPRDTRRRVTAIGG